MTGPGGMGGGQPPMTGGVTGGAAPRGRGSQQSAGQPG